MNLEMFAAWVVVGLVTGYLAGIVMKDGSYGLIWDLTLGLAGSGAASVIFTALGAAPESGGFLAAAVVAFAGAAIVIVAQRKMYAQQA